MTVFYTSLGTAQSRDGFFVPLGFVPGVDETLSIDLITLEHFHGIAEMDYYIGKSGFEDRSEIHHAAVKTDALGLPIITIPLSDLESR